MDKLNDMDLFVRVVNRGGMAAAGRELGLSPASVTARINRLEKHYQLKLLYRTTRSVTPTDEGLEFFASCEHILREVHAAENQLLARNTACAGPLRITATIDLGQQHIEPLLSKYVAENPDVSPHILLTDDVVNLAEEGFDLGIRYGQLADSTLIARKLAESRRVLCASPDYLEAHGQPSHPNELKDHHCITLIRSATPVTNWYFDVRGTKQTVAIKSTRATNDGALMRQWAVEGAGIALKSIWDIQSDIVAGRLVTVLDEFPLDFYNCNLLGVADLNAVYPNKEYLPIRTRGFINTLIEHFSSLALTLPVNLKPQGT